MKKMCAPKPCPCPTKSASVSSGILGPIKFALKAALAGALVFLTVDIGMWGDPETTETLYYTIYKTILPQQCKDEDEEPPRESFLDRSQHKELCEAYQGLMEYVSVFYHPIGGKCSPIRCIIPARYAQNITRRKINFYGRVCCCVVFTRDKRNHCCYFQCGKFTQWAAQSAGSFWGSISTLKLVMRRFRRNNKSIRVLQLSRRW